MALLTLPGYYEKGASATFILDKDALFALSGVTADAYFSVQSQVSLVKFVYKSQVGGQLKIVLFDLTQSAPSAQFPLSEFARDYFELINIILIDFDGGSLTLSSASIPSGFNVNTSEDAIELENGMYLTQEDGGLILY